VGAPNPTFPTQSKKSCNIKGGPPKVFTTGQVSGPNDLASSGDPWSRLDGQVELELLHQQLLISIEFRVAAED
jgi:hypothetical protein